MLCRLSYNVKYIKVDLFSPESWPEWDCVWRGIDWCSVCWSMTVHIKVDTPLEHVSTSARHVSAQEFRQCRETFSSTNRKFLCPYNAMFNFNLLGFIFCFVESSSRLDVSILAPTKLSIDCFETSDVPSGENVQIF